MTGLRKLLIIFCVVCSPVFASDEKYKDPDSPQVQAAAKAALANAKVLQIVGISRGIESLIEDLGGKVVGREIRLELAADVLFDFNKYDIRPVAVPTLQKVADVIKNYPKSLVRIEGHTDSIGADDYNLKLSDQRASSVKTWLQSSGGIEGQRMSTKGWGESKPVAPNSKKDGSDDPEGRQKNRRVEIVITRQS
jgi:outer membrane protein OmpA-like peptidoglycan-associated protein